MNMLCDNLSNILLFSDIPLEMPSDENKIEILWSCLAQSQLAHSQQQSPEVLFSLMPCLMGCLWASTNNDNNNDNESHSDSNINNDANIALDKLKTANGLMARLLVLICLAVQKLPELNPINAGVLPHRCFGSCYGAAELFVILRGLSCGVSTTDEKRHISSSLNILMISLSDPKLDIMNILDSNLQIFNRIRNYLFDHFKDYLRRGAEKHYYSYLTDLLYM